MKKLACLTAAVAALIAIGAESPANAAMGQCFDAYGRPVGPPHNTDNPPYNLICSVYAQGGSCTHVQPGWAESNCGYTPGYSRPGYQYDDGPYYSTPRYSRPRYYTKPRYYSPPATPQEREKRRALRHDPNLKFLPAHPDPNQPPIPDRGPPNTAR